MTDLRDRCAALIAELGLGRPEDIHAVTPLTGGVASDIARVDLGTRSICVKFALPKLKVAADWEVPVHRNAAEYAWLEMAARVAPGNAVAVLGRSEALHGFAMEYLAGPDVYLWKTALLAEAPDRGEAARVAQAIARLQAASTAPGFDTRPFHNNADFRAIRVEPYFAHLAGAYPELASLIEPVARMLDEGRGVVIHGDASPKNILFRGQAPVLLDAECATLGDAAFDPAFCLNHLLLKAIHLPRTRTRLLDNARTFWDAYAGGVTWEPVWEVEARVCAMLPALLLARVDGKSPVEYLNADARDVVRAVAIGLMRAPAGTLAEMLARLSAELGEAEA